MGWLRDHFYNFVFPALELRRVNYKVKEEDVKERGPFWPKVPEDHPYTSPKYFGGKRKMPSEIRALHYWCHKYGIRFSCQVTQARSPKPFHWDVIQRNLISSEALRRELGCPCLLLTGRDMWLFEVLARRFGFPSIYLPQISRNVSTPYKTTEQKNILKFLQDNGVTGNELFVDTGFAGSVPAGIQNILNEHWEYPRPKDKKEIKVKSILVSQSTGERRQDLEPIYTHVPHPKLKGNVRRDPSKRPNQIFPNRKRAREEALVIEYLPKYFCSGSMYYGEVYQVLAELPEIISAAIITSLVWRGTKGLEDLGESEKPKPKKPQPRKAPKKKKKNPSNYFLILNGRDVEERFEKKREKRRKYKRLARLAKKAKKAA